MTISSFQHQEMMRRLDSNRKCEPEPTVPVMPEAACLDESKLHGQIMGWCDAQYPQWIWLRARMDRKSTINPGAHDLTVWGPFPLCILVEAKSKNGKLSEDQQIWASRFRRIGWTVHVVRSFERFLDIVKSSK